MRRVLKQILLFILVTAILFTNIQISQAAGTGTVRVNDFYQMKSQEESTIIKEEKSQEEGNQEKIELYLKNNLSKYVGKVHNVVLGCTHYPLIQNEIKEVLGDVEFFNGASSLAKHLKDILEEKDLISNSKSEGTVEFVDSSNSEYKRERFLRQLGQS